MTRAAPSPLAGWGASVAWLAALVAGIACALAFGGHEEWATALALLSLLALMPFLLVLRRRAKDHCADSSGYCGGESL